MVLDSLHTESAAHMMLYVHGPNYVDFKLVPSVEFDLHSLLLYVKFSVTAI